LKDLVIEHKEYLFSGVGLIVQLNIKEQERAAQYWAALKLAASTIAVFSRNPLVVEFTLVSCRNLRIEVTFEFKDDRLGPKHRTSKLRCLGSPNMIG